jgi:hypothetical protein
LRSEICCFSTGKLSTPSFRDPQQFVGPGIYYSAHGAFGPAVGDLNEDGRLDIVTTTSTPAGVEIFLNTGSGKFTSVAALAVPGANNVIVADVNGDGHLDLVTANSQHNTVSVLLGNGAGSFGAPIYSPAGPAPIYLFAGDFNGDGHLDLIVTGVTNAGSLVSTLLPGKGDGTFGGPKRLPLTMGTVTSLTAGDFNRDGNLDVVIANGSPSNTVSVWLGNGHGDFTLSRSYSTGQFPSSVVVADFNRDGILDVVVQDRGLAPQNGDVALLLGNGDGTFQPATLYSAGTQVQAIAVADLHGNGNLGVVASGNTGVFLLEGDGAGGLRPAATSLALPYILAVADVNGDGKADLIGGSPASYYNAIGSTSFIVALNNGDGTFPAAVNYYPAAGATQGVTGDFNGDGIPDLVVAGPASLGIDGYATIYIGKGDGTYNPEGNSIFDIGGPTPVSLVAADMNLDGRLDLIVGTASPGGGTFGILLGNGDGTFSSQPFYGLGNGPLAVGDFNGDGKPDIAVAVNPSAGIPVVQILLGDGRGGFSYGSAFSLTGGACNFSVTDVNRDGKPDLLVDECGTFQAALNNGDGTFLLGPLYGGESGTVVVGDFNGDGFPDVGLTFVNPYCDFFIKYGQIGVSFGNGDGTFQAPVLRNSPISCSIPDMLAADFNGDGKLDLLELGSNFPQSIAGASDLFLAHGAPGTFESAEGYLAGNALYPNPASGLVANLNRDSAPDFVTFNGSFFTVGMNASGVLETLQSSANPSKVGQTVTFTAKVRPSFQSSGVPAGSVTFLDGNKVLAIVPLKSRSAKWNVSTLTAESHRITAEYSGDGTFVSSRAAIEQHVVH